jgi:hypothetical protein
VTTSAGNTLTQALTGTEQLSHFFPGAARVAIRAILKLQSRGAKNVQESVLVEFASIENAVFSSTLPLDFADLVQLQHEESNTGSEARVVAVQYHDGRKAVAVQFVNPQLSWVRRP